MATPTLQALDPNIIIASNHRQLSKIGWKKREGLDMATAINKYFDDNGIPLTKRMDEAYADDWQELARMYYMLKGGNRSIVANFEQDGQSNPMLLAHWYSRHRHCPVWNMRKSQLIRKKYREFLTEHTVWSEAHNADRLLIQEYTPVHMVLTMPHKNGEYGGQRFYARQLLAAFAEVRRCAYWKRWIYGGEYGLEIKKSGHGNGLHIHMHSLCFLQPGIKTQAFGRWLRAKWEKLTGASMAHFETLYYFKKGPDGRYITELARHKKDGQWQPQPAGYYGAGTDAEYLAEPQLVRKKHYINKDSNINEYLQGVMECIKYHFKNDSLKDENDEWDVPLMQDILNNSRNLRFYSRFGAFYKQPKLNFNNLEAQQLPPDDLAENPEDEVTDQLTDDDIMGNASAVEKNLVNPWTGDLADREAYTVCIVQPEKLTFKKDVRGIHQLYDYDQKDFVEAGSQFTLKEIIRAVTTGTMHTVTLGRRMRALVNIIPVNLN